MGQVLAFNSSRKTRGGALSSARTTCPDLEEQYAEEIRGKLDLWTAELSRVVASLEAFLKNLQAKIDALPDSQAKVDLTCLRTEIVLEIYIARRILADV